MWIRFSLQSGMGPTIESDDKPMEVLSPIPTERHLNCGQCNKSCKTRYALTLHSVVHSNNRPYSCSLCDKKFKQTGVLKSHMLHIHTAEKPFRCVKCKKRFPTVKVLSQHVKAVHPTRLRFECSQCNKRFKTPGNLQNHSVVHSDVYPYPCNQCDKQYKLRGLLKYHLSHNHAE
eukprot:677661_1